MFIGRGQREAPAQAELRPTCAGAFLRQPAIYLSELTQKTVQIFIFPASCSVVAVKFTFSAIEFRCVNSSTPIFVNLLRNHGVQQFVVNDVLEEPGCDKWRIQQRMDTNHFVLLLHRSEDEV